MARLANAIVISPTRAQPSTRGSTADTSTLAAFVTATVEMVVKALVGACPTRTAALRVNAR